jgi:hypothetical protein
VRDGRRGSVRIWGVHRTYSVWRARRRATMDNERLHYRVRGRRNMCYHKNSFSDAGSTCRELSLQQKHVSCQIKRLEKAICLPLRSLFIKEAPDFDRLPIPMRRRTHRWPEQQDHVRHLRVQNTESRHQMRQRSASPGLHGEAIPSVRKGSDDGDADASRHGRLPAFQA